LLVSGGWVSSPAVTSIIPSDFLRNEKYAAVKGFLAYQPYYLSH
jgi:hypothetical protein